jgi:prepilin-type processing-associated H-X9-DG protein
MLMQSGGYAEPLAFDLLVTSHPLFLARAVTVVADGKDQLALRLQFDYRKEATAAVSSEMLEALVQVLRRRISQLASEPRAPGGGDVEILGVLNRLLPSTKVVQDGTHVQVSTQCDPRLATMLFAAVAQTRVSARRVQSQNNLKQIALAMHNYHDTFGRFPSAVVRDKEGKALYSWRVLLLPFLEQDNLYKQFKLDEPWDSEHNRPLVAQMPRLYAIPEARNAPPGGTFYQVLVDGGALFDSKGRGTRMSEITDGTSNTLMVVEAAEAVPWTKPEDLTYDPKGPLPKFGNHFRGGFNAAFADGSVQFLPHSMPEQFLRGLITRAGGEVVPRMWENSGRPRNLELDAPGSSGQSVPAPKGYQKKMTYPKKGGG